MFPEQYSKRTKSDANVQRVSSKLTEKAILGFCKGNQIQHHHGTAHMMYNSCTASY